MPKKHTISNKTKKRKGKDMDQIIEEMRSEKQRCFATQHVNFNLDLPGDGHFYCIQCARYFIDEKSLSSHRSSKVHRQRLKRLREPAYTQREAEESVGLKTTSFA
ncbi:Zinc-finger double-stranded RNA-binding family protein [Acanthocheilonema viteae]